MEPNRTDTTEAKMLYEGDILKTDFTYVFVNFECHYIITFHLSLCLRKVFIMCWCDSVRPYSQRNIIETGTFCTTIIPRFIGFTVSKRNAINFAFPCR